MAIPATTALQMAIMAAAAYYLVCPDAYYAVGDLVNVQTGRMVEQLSEHEAVKAVTEGLQRFLHKLPYGVPLEVVERAKKPEGNVGAGAVVGASFEGLECETSMGKVEAKEVVEGLSEPSFATTPASPSGSAASDDDEIFFHEPSNLYGDQASPSLPTLSQAELDTILDRIHRRRSHRHNEMQRRIQRCRSGSVPFDSDPEEPLKKKAKKTVRFALDTKSGSLPTSISPSNASSKDEATKLLSPLPPSPSGELAYFSAAIAAPNGSLFAHPTREFNEADLIRRLPSQMKNGAGGLAYCRGRTEQGLYMLDTPVRRLLLDLRAGVCYDGRDGRMLGMEEVMGCMLWGRGRVEERWGGFRWTRGLEGVGK